MAIPRKLFASLTALSALLLSGVVQATADLNMRQGVTENSIAAYDLHMMVVWVMTVIAIIVFGAMFYSFIFHRKSKHPIPATWSHSTKMEIIWTTIPVIILVALTIPAIKLLIKMEDTSEPEMSIQVTGSQWKWHYKYLENDISLHGPWKNIKVNLENFSKSFRKIVTTEKLEISHTEEKKA